MYVRTRKKCVKFFVKIPSGCSENGKQLQYITFSPPRKYWFPDHRLQTER